MPDDALYETIAESLRVGFRRHNDRRDPTEADVRQLVIAPALEALGYTGQFRRPELEKGSNRPDEICYVSELLDDSGYAALVVEAKAHKTNFDKAPPGRPRSDSPDRQIQRYLRQHPASGPNTIGLLTDGVRWRVYERAGSPASFDVRFLREYDFAAVANAASASPLLDGEDALREFADRLCRECVLDRMRAAPRVRRTRLDLAERLLAEFAGGPPQPDALLPHLLGGRMAEISYDLAERAPMEGVLLDASERDWDAYAYADGTPLPSAAAGQAPLPTLGGLQVAVAAARFAPDAAGLSRGDAALCARAFARASNARMSVLLAYQETVDGATEARLAVCAGGRAAMTAPFDPEMPSPSAKAAVEEVLAALAERETTADRLLAPLEVAPLRQRFYAEVSAWTKRLAARMDPAGREAVLRHLIRVMFAWILKEDGLIPAELFERGFADATMRDPNRYHADVLRFLFHQRLNVPDEKRDPHPNADVDAALEAAPFLNGSLFHEQDGDGDLDIPIAGYWNPDEAEPGLFTIFSRYHWTTDEHRPGESDQTLDPELLSNLFERLILPIESDETLDRQPRGTYYTPADVTAEMTKDALAAAARTHAPKRMTDAQLLDLFGDPGAPLPAMSGQERTRLAERVRAIRVFDPAVGSGAFLFGCLAALQTAREKLEPDAQEPTPEIIKSQLHGQDIHPLAAQITRLRLFIALKAADRKANRDAPLPNLEARVVCADTLGTVADPDWRPSRSGRLADRRLSDGLTAVAETRQTWMDAHSEEEKQAVLRAYSEAGERLSLLLRENSALASTELEEFADNTPLFPGPAAAKTDARLLFYENPWRGFDVVIGNPPYEALSESLTADETKLLAERKRYRTTRAGNLYPLFCEAALALAKPDGGIVTMITPMSVAARASHRPLRERFEERCVSIGLRHYDNRPDPVFSASPTVKSPENRQRATVLTAVTGSASEVAIWTTGLQRMPSDEREQCLRRRPTVRVPQIRARHIQISGQWPRIPTPEVAQMVAAMLGQEKTVGDYESAEGPTLSIPNTAYMYVSYVPQGAVLPRIETPFTVENDDALCLLMAALNGHVGYAWWAMFSDGFNLTRYQTASMAIPNSWQGRNRDEAITLGRRLIAAMPDCKVVSHRIGQQIWPNVDFHTHAPDLIEEIDRLYIEALGLPAEPLLTHLRIMRSSSSWDFGEQG